MGVATRPGTRTVWSLGGARSFPAPALPCRAEADDVEIDPPDPATFGSLIAKHKKTTEPVWEMSNEKSQNVQDVFLNNIRRNKIPVTIFLVNGVKLQGIVTWFDNFSVLLRRDAHSQLVYKHAISTVMPSTPVQLFEGSKDEDEN